MIETFFIRIYGGSPGNISPLAQSFETFAELVTPWDGMFFEMDGSFVWVGNDSHEGKWQVDGMVYDLGTAIQYIELKGACPKSVMNQLLEACGEGPMCFHSVQQDRWLREI